MSIKIDKGIPVPRKLHTGKTIYPFHEMEIGDSFFASVTVVTLKSSAVKHGYKYGKQFTIRKEGDGARCWRIA
jgi:hypothetical protein